MWGISNAPGVRLRKRHAFTLVELLAVVAIVLLLAALLLPALRSTRARANAVSCTHNLRQLGLAAFMYAGDSQGQIPCPTDAFGTDACWFFATDPYLLGLTVTNAPSPRQRIARIKQDPVWSTFDTRCRTNWRTFKMNRKLVGNQAQGTVAVTSAKPPWRRLQAVPKSTTTPLYHDGRCEEVVTNSPDRLRYDGWEVYVARRHFNGGNILFIDGHADFWRWGVPGGVGGYQVPTTGLTWWVE